MGIKTDDPRWRKIVRHDRYWKETTSEIGSSYSWRRSEHHTLTLECGHTLIRGGRSCPVHRVLCKDCEAGKRRKKVKVELGYFDHTRGAKIEDPIARALITNAHKKAAAAASV